MVVDLIEAYYFLCAVIAWDTGKNVLLCVPWFQDFNSGSHQGDS